MFLHATTIILAVLLAVFPFVACMEPEAPEVTKPTNKRIAFTFDDGPTPRVTDKILDKLEELGGRATFFQVANRHNYVGNETYTRIKALGCEVGTHTYEHPMNFSKLSNVETREQLTRSKEALREELGYDVRLFRPVGGAASTSQLDAAARLGLHTVNWSLDTNDWTQQTNDTEAVKDFIDETVDYILENAEDGDIILMHELYMSSYEIFARAATELSARGYELVTVSEMLGLTESTKPTATMYTKGEPFIDPDAVG